jgi:hypothetical protein
VVEAFLQDVINEHHGDHAADYLNPGMQWSGGTVGTITGSANVAGLFAGVVRPLTNSCPGGPPEPGPRAVVLLLEALLCRSPSILVLLFRGL